MIDEQADRQYSLAELRDMEHDDLVSLCGYWQALMYWAWQEVVLFPGDSCQNLAARLGRAAGL